MPMYVTWFQSIVIGFSVSFARVRAIPDWPGVNANVKPSSRYSSSSLKIGFIQAEFVGLLPADLNPGNTVLIGLPQASKAVTLPEPSRRAEQFGRRPGYTKPSPKRI